MRRLALFMLLVLLDPPSSLGDANPPASMRSKQIVARQRSSLEGALTAKGFQWGAPLFIRIFKDERTLEVWLHDRDRFRHFKSYRICTYGGMGLGPKTRQGDRRAPEGFYFVTGRQMNPYSRYHLAFNLGYPNAYDRVHGRTGSALMVHGNCVSIGCFAMTNASMEAIYGLADAALRNGQPFFRVHIFPFRMTDKLMRGHRRSPWLEFWRNLKEGYDWFGEHGFIPPNVEVEKGYYVFEPASPDR